MFLILERLQKLGNSGADTPRRARELALAGVAGRRLGLSAGAAQPLEGSLDELQGVRGTTVCPADWGNRPARLWAKGGAPVGDLTSGVGAVQ